MRTERGSKSLIRMRIKFAVAGVLLNGDVELLGIECLEPCAKPGKLARGKLFDGFFNVFGGSHAVNIAFDCDAAKVGLSSGRANAMEPASGNRG